MKRLSPISICCLLSITPLFLVGQCQLAATCQDISDAHTITINTSQALSYQQVQGCVERSEIREDVIVGDYVHELAAIYYVRVFTDADASSIVAHLSSPSASHDSYVNLYEDNCPLGNRYYQHIEDLSPSTDYMLVPTLESSFLAQVVVVFDSMPDSSIDFTIDMSAHAQLADCEGIEADGLQEEAVFEIVNRSTNLSGFPFFPGEEVTVAISFDFSRQNTFSAEWLHTVVPSLGEGWDLDFLDLSLAEATSSNGGEVMTYEYDDECPIQFAVDLPYYCTYQRADGKSILCNLLTENCPCKAEPIEQGELLYSDAWSWLTATQSCSSSCSHSSTWGIGSNAVTISAILNLRVREDAKGFDDLQISIARYSDAVTGCYQSSAGICEPDLSVRSPRWSVVGDSTFTKLAKYDEKLCSSDPFELGVLLYFTDGDSFFVDYVADDSLLIDMPSDILTEQSVLVGSVQNKATDERQVTFRLWQVMGLDSTLVDQSVITILPDYKLIVSGLEACPGDCVQPNITDNHGGEGTYTIVGVPFVCDETEPTVIIGHSNFCGMDTIEVQLDLYPEMSLSLQLPRDICRNGMPDVGDDRYIATVDIQGGLPPYEMWWDGSALGNELVVDGKPAVVILEEQVSLSSATTIRAVVIDANACRLDATGVLPLLQDINIDAGEHCQDGIFDPANPDLILKVPAFPGRQIQSVTWLRVGTIVSGPVTDSTFVVNEEESSTGLQSAVVAFVVFSDDCEVSVDYDFDILSDDRSFEYEVVDFEVDFTPLPLVALQTVHWDFGDGSSSDEFFPTHIYEEVGTYQVTMTAIDICDTSVWTSEVIIFNTTTEETASEEEVIIYPNPVHSTLLLEWQSQPITYGITVLDMQGRIVLQQLHKDDLTAAIDLSALSAGIYLVSVESGQGKYIKKISKL